MATITLKDLKKENEKDEEAARKAEEERQRLADEALENDEDDLGDNEGEGDNDDQLSGDEDADPDDSGEGDDEGDDSEGDPDADDQDPDKKAKAKNGPDDDWMLDDEGQPPTEKKFTDADAGKIRKKYKGTIDELRAENEELKKRQQEPPPATPSVKPDLTGLQEPIREKFKTDLEYLEARQDYLAEVSRREMQTQQQASQHQQKKTEAKRKAEEAVDAHYLRAHQLTEQSGIAPERYQAADTVVRRALDNKFPGAGDATVDALIARIGTGSEKVIFNLGVNRARLDQLLATFEEDPSGIEAAIYLGDLRAKLATPAKRQSNAPKPPGHTSGDGKQQSGQKRLLLKAYRTAHTKNDPQAAFNAKKKAKGLGIDVSDW